jgi:hypothetical protein
MGNVTSSVAARLAFFPPEPATYGVEPAAGGGLLRMTGVSSDAGVEVRALPTRAGTRVVSAFWRHPAARLTLLYSHGNAADLGQMLGLFLELRAHLRVNIMRSVSCELAHHAHPPSPLASARFLQAFFFLFAQYFCGSGFGLATLFCSLLACHENCTRRFGLATCSKGGLIELPSLFATTYYSLVVFSGPLFN